MRFQYLLLALGAIVLLSQPVCAQSWGQLKNLAVEAQSSKKYAEAADFWVKALSACDNTSGPRYVQSMSGLAHSYAELEKYVDADNCYKKIVELAKSGSVSDDQKSALVDYVAFLRKQKRESEADDLQARFSLPPRTSEQAESDRLSNNAATDGKADGSSEQKDCQLLLSTGTKELALKHYSQAEQLFKQALAASEKLAEARKLTSESLNKLILVYFAQEKYGLAEPYYQQSLANTRKFSGSESKDYAHALMGYGQLLRRLNRKPEAMAEEARAERILSSFNVSIRARAGSLLQQSGSDPSATRRGSLYQRAGAAQQGFSNGAAPMMNSPE